MSDPETTIIALAQTAAEIRRCHPVMRELRPRYHEDEFVAQVQRQIAHDGYRLACLERAGEVRAVAGYRFGENLHGGRYLYVDDLVTRATDRSCGFGATLFDWLVAEARRHNCASLTLDSGVQRFGAHRFYLTKRMDITSHHFGLDLTPASAVEAKA
jgi:GNAT superfamily N-acetyltransferase